jgi:hypothetical protein
MFTGHPHTLAALTRQHHHRLAVEAEHARLRREARRRRKT